jgi:S1-C subfamily serine protease
LNQRKMYQKKRVDSGRPYVRKAHVASFVVIALAGLATAFPNPAQPTSPDETNQLQVRPGLSIGENTVADIAAAVAPAVVNVEITLDPNGPKPVVKGAQSNPFSEKSQPNRQSQRQGFPPKVIGSGLIVRPDGYLVTNYHLVRHAGDTIQVSLQDERAFKAKVIGTDRFTDLAVLKIEANNLHTVPFALGKKVRAGEWAIAIGNPFGYDHTVTLGIVSAINRAMADGSNHADLIQTDAAINTGNSGGPLLNIHGEVIGLTSSTRGNAQNIAFAIPADVVNQVTNTLIKNGSATKPYVMERPYLGFFMKDWDNRIVSNPIFPRNSQGVILLRVVGQSPGEKCGLKAGDFITKVGGTPISNVKELRAITRQHKPGDVVAVEGSRNGQNFVKRLTIGKYPDDEPWNSQ